ncbi:DUF454 domain-containing protein [Psychromonas sp. psych-6C06]|uniref:YbaN family protein n=1 Tax=Psychromonas sp. psych-6C06 TaxID=2058089 RepID=UPI000C334AD1|nr:YbaN family protein [Psychromonas sp. psych-6C06]PKF61853.1 DUF454 domain-containing protein [Psychromonas sp. psych-6C06]
MVIAFVSILLGLIGIVLPLLPTTPFFILALACFARSSTRFHKQLLNAPYIGKTLTDWQQRKCIDKQRKLQIQLIVVASFTLSFYLLNHYFYVQILLLFIMLILLFFIRRIKEC